LPRKGRFGYRHLLKVIGLYGSGFFANVEITVKCCRPALPVRIDDPLRNQACAASPSASFATPR
jgi:hypothetical protein